jgi:alpha-N-arabinofuranosidase
MKRTSCLLLALILTVAARAGAADPLRIAVDPGRAVNPIDEKIYGHFLEHIYHSVNGGLWGELVWNRSFEENNAGQWRIEGDEILQQSMGTDQRLLFGDPKWRDYEFSLEAKKLSGQEGFLILFRAPGEESFYWCNLGGWGNDRHGIERGRRGEGRWHIVGPTVPGQIEQGKWYRIRVRCEGPRIQIWLDDRRLFDFTDDAKAHLAGRVGVGTWATKAAYRNVKVAALDGRVLHQGVPELVAQSSVAKHWQPYGDGQALIDSRAALNSKYYQRLVSRGGPSGVRQSPFAVRQGETYVGSLWARGQAAPLVVRLLDGEKVLAEAKLPGGAAEWTERPFSLAPSASADNATLSVGLAGRGEVDIDQVSLMPKSWRDAGGFRPDLLQAVADLRPPVIRWPGGCFAEWYRWKDGIGPQHLRGIYPIDIWDDQDVNSYGTDEFLAMCRRVGAEPLIVINIGSHDDPAKRQEYIEEACQWIEYCNGPADSTWGKRRAANGHPEPYGVKYWEIDNETWRMRAEPYVEAVKVFAPAMKKTDPSIKLLACGSGGYGREGNGLAWNRTVIEGCAELIDYLSIHHYENPDRFAQGPRDYEKFFHETAEIIAASKNPAVKIYVSEWNAQSTDWRTGLYAGGILNAFERSGDVLEIGGPALFLRHVSATSWDNAFINFDHRTWFPAPNYVVMKLWRDHYGAERIATDGDEGPLNASASRSADGRQVFYKAVNPSDAPVKVELALADAFPVGKSAIHVVAPGSLEARNTLDDPGAVKVEPGEVQVDGQQISFELPALSAAVVVIEKK